jgi:hypothetical protein
VKKSGLFAYKKIMALIEITNTNGAVNIKDVEAPDSHQKLDFSATAGSFDTELVSVSDGAGADDMLVITHASQGRIGAFKAFEFSTPSGADLQTIRPLVEALLTI